MNLERLPLKSLHLLLCKVQVPVRAVRAVRAVSAVSHSQRVPEKMKMQSPSKWESPFI
jgi:hypothetical protein